jgi:acetyl-CoA carboxylase biotin carboxyl carrier protein
MAANKRSGRAPRRADAKAAASAARAPKDAEIARLKRLLALMHEHGLAELEIGAEGNAVRLSRLGSAAPAMHAAGSHAFAAPAEAARASDAPAPAKASPAGEPFLSPMVGTLYRAPTPEAKPFVMEGEAVKPDTVICIIEAMKVMNEIKAERTGKIVQILVENGEAVEYGQPLFLIQRT